MKIETERLVIREFEEADLTNLIRNIDDLEVSRYLALVPHPYTEKDGKWWINNCKEKAEEKPRKSYEFCIELKEEGKLVGGIGLSGFDELDGTITLGYWLGRNHHRKGIMSEAVSRVIEFAFEELKLIRIDVEAFVGNEGSQKIIERRGFEYEGLRKEFVKCKATDKIHDVKVYGLLKKDWKK